MWIAFKESPTAPPFTTAQNSDSSTAVRLCSVGPVFTKSSPTCDARPVVIFGETPSTSRFLDAFRTRIAARESYDSQQRDEIQLLAAHSSSGQPLGSPRQFQTVSANCDNLKQADLYCVAAAFGKIGLFFHQTPLCFANVLEVATDFVGALNLASLMVRRMTQVSFDVQEVPMVIMLHSEDSIREKDTL